MATASDVLTMLIPSGGWAISGETYEGITFLEAEPITKEEFEAYTPKQSTYSSGEATKETT